MKCPKCGSEDITFSRWQLHPASYCCNCRWFFTDWQQSLIEDLKQRLDEAEETLLEIQTERNWKMTGIDAAAEGETYGQWLARCYFAKWSGK